MRITLPSGTAAELARPGTGDATAGLVVLPDIMGLRTLFDDLAQRLADDNGWVVCAPEPFAGHEDLTLDERLGFVGRLTDDRVLGDAVAAADATGFDQVGVIGFCMGGMYTLKAAGTGRFRRAAAFYGMIRVPEQWQGPGHGEPLDAVQAPGACPAMAIIGEEDRWTPPADVEALEGAGVEVVRYAGADHGFVHDPSRPAHRPDDATDAWRRVTTFLNAD